MSQQAFQRALCDLAASPVLCRSMRSDPDRTLQRYGLSAIEQKRLISIVHQRGMATSCALYRANRITPVYTLLPLTCFLLGDDLGHVAELFWKTYEKTDLQYEREIDVFAAFLKQQICGGALRNPLLQEVLDFELAVNRLRFLPRRKIAAELQCGNAVSDGPHLQLHPLVKVVRFQHEPTALLQLLNEMRPQPYELSEGTFWLLLDAVGDELEVKRIDPRLGLLLHEIDIGSCPLLSSDDVDMLVDVGLVMRSGGKEAVLAKGGDPQGRAGGHKNPGA